MRWYAVASTEVRSAGAWKNVGRDGERAGGRGSMPAFVRKDVM